MVPALCLGPRGTSEISDVDSQSIRKQIPWYQEAMPLDKHSILPWMGKPEATILSTELQKLG